MEVLEDEAKVVKMMTEEEKVEHVSPRENIDEEEEKEKVSELVVSERSWVDKSWNMSDVSFQSYC